MKLMKGLLGILVLTFVGAGLFAACGEVTGDCVSDDDCESGEACEYDSGSCLPTCDDNDDCLAEESCEEREPEGSDESVMVCEEIEDYCEDDIACGTDTLCDFDTNECVTDCTDDEEVCGEGEYCKEREEDDKSICVEGEPDPFYFYARVQDTSETGSDEACENPDTNDPGSDLFGIELVKDGESYWATLTYEAVRSQDESGDPNDHDDAEAILDGESPEFDENEECADGFTDHVVALGCDGGSVIVEFLDEEGENIEIEGGDQITVYEFGEQTCGGHPEDSYRLEICTTGQDEVESGDCDGIDQGENDEDVTTFDINLDE
ncbi:MAG: hypothetical protein ACOCV2_00240 [Persicimonas sp.]